MARVPPLVIKLRLGLGGCGGLGGFECCGLEFGDVGRSGCLLACASVSIGFCFAWLLSGRGFGVTFSSGGWLGRG